MVECIGRTAVYVFRWEQPLFDKPIRFVKSLPEQSITDVITSGIPDCEKTFYVPGGSTNQRLTDTVVVAASRPIYASFPIVTPAPPPATCAVLEDPGSSDTALCEWNLSYSCPPLDP